MGNANATAVKQRWGHQLRQAREARGWSQLAAGFVTELQPSTISRAENGEGSLNVYHRYARKLGVTLEAGDAS